MSTDGSLLDALAGALPKDLQLRVFHISTRPASVPALYSAARDQIEQKTYCESNLLGIALPQVDGPHEVLVFAIEVIIFTTKSLTTIFVSKADSTGCLDILHLEKGTGSIIRNVTVEFLRFLINRRSAGPRLVLSLFARSQNQYLFPGSVEYAGKHILDDRQLIKWWCKTLDPIVRYPGLYVEDSSSKTTAYVLIPGCDNSETRAFFPVSAKQDSPESAVWISSYPMKLLVPDVSAPLRCLIPRLPDDPKLRFLTDLDDSKDEKGLWRSVKTMEQFWEMMSFRQECSAGRVVGFIWVVFGNQKTLEKEGEIDDQIGMQQQRIDANSAVLPTPGHSQVNGDTTDTVSELTAVDLEEVTLPGSLPPSSPVLLPCEADTPETNKVNATADEYYDEEQTLPISWPEETRGELIVNLEQYDTLIDHLLQSDFSTRADAEEGTTSFIAKAAELGGRSWGRSIIGRKASFVGTGADSMSQETDVNILTGVRKKRKVELVEEKSSVLQPKVNLLGAGLIRKKAKT